MESFVVAKAFVVNDKGELLVLRRSQTDDRRPGELDFVGGWVDPGEDMTEAVKREGLEEAGLQLVDPKLVYAFSEMTTDHGSGTWLLYVEHVKGRPDVILSYEHDASYWKKPEEILKEIKYERQRNMLAYVLENNLLVPPSKA